MAGGFTQAWLRQYQSKHQAAPLDTGPITFTLSKPTLLLNQLVRMHWTARGRYQRALAEEIASLVPHIPGRQPLQHAVVTVERRSVGIGDQDGVIGGLKPMIDCLLVRSTRHPTGLGLILDDDPAHMTLIVRAIRVQKRAEQCTVVRIEREAANDLGG
jgi:hypothetical protein